MTSMDKQTRPSRFRQAIGFITGSSRPESQKNPAPHMIAAMLGLAAPIAVGAAAGHLQNGVAASLGALIIGTQTASGSMNDRILPLARTIIAGAAAMLIGTAISGLTCTGWMIVVICAMVAFFGGISRPLARATTQFLIFLIIAANMNPAGGHPLGMTALFVAGAVWSSVLLLCLETLLSRISDGNHRTAALHSEFTMRQYLLNWRRNLRQWKGWQYTVRITVCLAAAEMIRRIWPHDHSYWISLTVAIVVHRDLSSALTRTLQRALGTFLGVMLISIFLLGFPPLWVVIAVVAGLSAARSVLIDINYIAYTAAMTPLIILLLDFGRPPSTAILTSRLLATLTGCLIALILGYVIWKKWIGGPQKTVQTP
jgi:hypothetical protein